MVSWYGERSSNLWDKNVWQACLMYKKSSDMTVEKASELKGGVGTIKLINILNVDEMYGMGRFFGVTVIPPNCSTGIHTHKDDFETYYILKGTAEVTDNDDVYILEAGDMTQCPAGSSHSIRNIGNEDLEYIAMILYTEKR